MSLKNGCVRLSDTLNLHWLAKQHAGQHTLSAVWRHDALRSWVEMSLVWLSLCQYKLFSLLTSFFFFFFSYKLLEEAENLIPT